MYIRLFSPILRRVIAVAVALLCQGFAVAQDEPLPNGARARLGTLRFRLGADLGGLTITPDGRLLASTGRDGKIRFFERTTGRQVRVLKGGMTEVRPPCLAFSPDGKKLAFGFAEEGGTQLWDVAGEQKVHCFPESVASEALAFSPDGKVLAGCHASTVFLWEAGTGRLLRQWGSERPFLNSLHFSADSRTLIAANDEGTVYFWDPASGKERRRWTEQGSLCSLALSPDGKILAAIKNVALKHGVHLWDVDSGRHLRSIALDPHWDADLTALVWASDGKSLVVGDTIGKLTFCDPGRGKVLYKAILGGRVASLLFVPGSQTVISGDISGVIRLWDGGTGKEIEPSSGHQGCVTALVFSPDGSALFSAGTEGALRCWQPATGRQLWCREEPSLLVGGQLALSPDGSLLALASLLSGGVHLYEAATGKTLRDLARGEEVLALAFSGGDKPVLAASIKAQDGTEIAVWDMRAGRRLQHRHYKGKRLGGIASCPDGKTLLALGYLEGGLYLLDAATLGELRALPATPFSNFALSKDERRLAVIVEDRLIELWDLPSGRRLFRLDEAAARLHSLAFSPDGATLAAGEREGAVRLWETATGRQRGHFMGHRGEVHCLAFAPDGRSLASGSADTTILLWALTGLADSKRKPPADEQLQALWKDLAGRDARRAYRAVWVLAQFPELSVSFLRQRLRPAASYSPERLSRLIRALGSDSFAVRQEAGQELETAEMQAEPALRAALAQESDLEVRRRVELLLGKLDERVRDPETLRAVRGVEVLEHAASAEARALLESLARGAEQARLTRQARAALERLSKRSP